MMSLSRDRDSNATYQADVGLTFEHRFKDWLWGRLGYRHANSTIFRKPLGFSCAADFRTRENFRWLNDGFFVRIQVQRDVTIGNYLFTPYASAEVYFDTKCNQMARYRLIVGVTLPVYEHFYVEPYLARQATMPADSPSPTPSGLP